MVETVYKKQVALVDGQATTVDTGSGPVTWLDQLKKYYKFAITALGFALVVIANVGPVIKFLGPDIAHYISVAIAIITPVLTFLKSNENWVDGL